MRKIFRYPECWADDHPLLSKQEFDSCGHLSTLHYLTSLSKGGYETRKIEATTHEESQFYYLSISRFQRNPLGLMSFSEFQCWTAATCLFITSLEKGPTSLPIPPHSRCQFFWLSNPDSAGAKQKMTCNNSSMKPCLQRLSTLPWSLM